MTVLDRIGHDYIICGRDCRTGRMFYDVRSDDNWRRQARYYDESSARAALQSRIDSRNSWKSAS